MSAPYFSVVIPTHKRLPMLLRVLDALEEQRGAPDLEVIVIDDGSGDDTSEVMRARRANHYTLTFRTQPNAGPGRARNHGVSLAAGRYILFIGDDTVPEPTFLAEHARIHRDAGDDPLVACLGYTGWPASERVTAFMDYINDFGLQFGYKLIRDSEIVPFNFFYTSNISLDRQLLGDEPVTRHYHPMTVDSFARRQYSVGRSGAIFYRKHPELAGFLGVHELETRALATGRRLAHLRRRARLGERFRVLATNRLFETLMREHYLRGLRDGLASPTPEFGPAQLGPTDRDPRS
jgi:glycosyltransferase involved in cell wall biosynthesis